ncbi:unnamed protein product [Leptidea sinapis]|uniref:Protein furry n=1 Tax=Leptidea sinapis TaxID=189913 RepID=A0A5E4Q892_9NEOP|nr:unnamed protein product [Leptidea sinapis]
MPMFSEITARFQTARTEVRHLLLQYLLPWLVNIELVDPNVPPANPLSYIQYYGAEGGRTTRREGLGSVEATEMVLNNLFYITVKFSDQHPKEIEELWSTLCACWPNNLKVIIRYLIIVSGMAPNELLPYDATGRTCELAPVEKGTIHTKRHSGEDPAKAARIIVNAIQIVYPKPTYESRVPEAKQMNIPVPQINCSVKSETPCRSQDKRASALPCTTPPADEEPTSPSDGDATPLGVCGSVPTTPQEARVDMQQPRPLPMPEYGGFFALLTECNVAVMLLCDVVLDGVELDWSIHVPLMLHIVFLGMDHTRWIVHQHCRQLLLNLLVAVAAHQDHLTVARILLAARSAPLQPPQTATPHKFTGKSIMLQPDTVYDGHAPCGHSPRAHVRSLSSDPQITPEGDGDNYPSLPVIVTSDETVPAAAAGGEACEAQGGEEQPVADVIKSLVHFLANRPSHQPLWQYEDITAKVAEQGEDMQGYVTELLLTLEAAVDSLESNFRPLDYMRDIFKSTPNLNNKEGQPTNGNVYNADYEHEFLLGVRLLSRVMSRLPLDRPDARERLDRTQVHAPQSPTSLHVLLLKGCTHPNTYEPVVGVLVDMIPLLELPVIDPTQSLAFPMTFTAEKSKKLENLGTVMTLYSRRTFSKESFQWTKCVVKYLWDTYSHLSLQMIAFLVEVLEKQQESNNYKEAMKILKLVVTRCSTLVVPPHWEHTASALDTLIYGKKSRVRECLVNLLTTCGQRVGLPKSPSVIFSQSSELLERESSMASSLEEVSGTPGNEPSGGAPPTDHFGVFKDFDFLEYESESIEEVTSKTISVCGEGVAACASELGAVLERLSKEEPPLLWAGPVAADCSRVRDAVRYAALEFNEHLETYFERREHALETLEVSHNAEETGRCLYKLIFQLLLLLETNNKMVMAVYHAAVDNRGVEMSIAVKKVRAALIAHAADSWAEHSPAPHDDATLLGLIQRQRWGVALALVRERNAERILERGELPEDDVTSLLHVYCKGLAQTHPVSDLSQNLSFMMESLYKVSVALQRTDFAYV